MSVKQNNAKRPVGSASPTFTKQYWTFKRKQVEEKNNE